MRPVTVSVGPLAAASANNIALTQTPAAGALFNLNGVLASGGVATLDTPRRVLFTFSGNESANTFTVTGTDWNNQVQVEPLAGTVAGTTYTATDFKTVTSIRATNGAAAAITVGTNTVASSAWVRLDEWSPFSTAIQCSVTGVVSYTVNQTLQDPNSPTNAVAPYALQWLTSADPAVVNATTTQQSSYTYAPAFARVTLNSGSGSVSAIFSQNASPSI